MAMCIDGMRKRYTENISCELDFEEWLRVHHVERRWEHSSKEYNMCKYKEVGKIWYI